MDSATPALLVGHHKLLESSGGGVQICNREYVAALNHAGFALRVVPFEFENGVLQRIENRLIPRLSNPQAPSGLFREIANLVRDTRAECVFFGLNLFPQLSKDLRQAFPNLSQVLLSHGVEGIDFFLEQIIRRRTGAEDRRRAAGEWTLGRQLLEAGEQRRWIDAVLTLSPFECEVEKWLGSGRVLWVPRSIMEARLDVRTVDQRVGCVSTLDHPPNLDGLRRLFDALEQRNVPPDFRFRLVGQPTGRGSALAERYAFVEYLGSLTDPELRSEAETWCCFVHPLFVYAKGCSTKLAFGVGWGLPVATTEFGARGYVWDHMDLPLAKTPAELAKFVLERSSRRDFPRYQQQTARILRRTPALKAIGEDIRAFLLGTELQGPDLRLSAGLP